MNLTHELEESHKVEHSLNPSTRINLERLNDKTLRERNGVEMEVLR